MGLEALIGNIPTVRPRLMKKAEQNDRLRREAEERDTQFRLETCSFSAVSSVSFEAQEG